MAALGNAPAAIASLFFGGDANPVGKWHETNELYSYLLDEMEAAGVDPRKLNRINQAAGGDLGKLRSIIARFNQTGELPLMSQIHRAGGCIPKRRRKHEEGGWLSNLWGKTKVSLVVHGIH